MPTAKVSAVLARWIFTLGWAACWVYEAGETFGQTDPTLARYDVTARPIELIPPGTVIDRTAPAPYTHLIVKSYPRLGAGDLHAVNEMTKQLASFLHTSLVARTGTYTVGGETRYRLEEVATGFGTNIRGRGDTVISPDTERKLGANLSFFQRLVLSKCYEEQQKSRYIVRSDTLAVVDTPLIILRNDQHRRAILRYALLLSERSGRLDTLMWMIDLDAQGRYATPAGEVHWLAPNTLVDCVMHVDADEFTLGVPSDIAFACLKTPQGKHAASMPDSLTPLAALPQFTPEQAKALEVQLWLLLQQLVAAK